MLLSPACCSLPRRRRILLTSRLLRIMHLVVMLGVGDLQLSFRRHLTSGTLGWRDFAFITTMGSFMAMLAPVMGYLEFKLQVRLRPAAPERPRWQCSP